MVTQKIKSRIGALEDRYMVAKEPPPTIFIFVTDASRPDPENPKPEVDYSDAAIIGARASRGDKGKMIERNPGEKMEAFKRRLNKTLPDQRLFFMCYHHESSATP